MRYLQIWAMASRGPTVTFKQVGGGRWTRHWTKYEGPAVEPGLISVNAQAYDWRWLLLGVGYECRQKHRDACSAGALDGQWGGYPLFENFRCGVDGRTITCRNTLGDAMRWRTGTTSS
jgi:hypothetical protein